MSRVLSFRGQLDDGEQEKIPLETIRGMKGYQITKFSLMCVQPGLGNQESVVQIFKEKQATVPTSAATVNFSQNRLLAAGIFTASTNQKTDPEDLSVIFDNEIFNQDIFITHTDNEAALPINYYFELEQTDLNMDEATVATLKNIRNS
jgi:hypothetical protein